MKQLFSFFLFLGFFVSLSAQPGLPPQHADSLWKAWKNESLSDTSRLKALNRYIRDGYMYKKPDSAAYFADISYAFARKKGLEKEAATALNLKGISYELRSNYPKALKLYHKSYDIYKKLKDTQHMAFTLGNIGIIHKHMGELEKALEYYRKGLKLRKKAGDVKGMAILWINIGTVYKKQGNHAGAIRAFTRCLKNFEELEELRGIAYSHGNIANTYYSQDEFDKAMIHYRKCLKVFKKMEDQNGIATAYNSIGLVHKKQEKLDSALEYHTKSLVMREKMEDKKGMADSYGNIGVIHERKGSYSEALGFFKESLNIRKSIGYKMGMATSYRNMGRIYFLQKNHSKAIAFNEKALRLAKAMGLTAEIKKATNFLYKSYKAIGSTGKALAMHEAYIEARDSIESEQNRKELIKQEFKYRYEKKAAADSIKAAEAAKVKDAKIAAQKAVNEKQKQRTYFLYAGLSLALLFGGFIFNRFRVTRRQKNIIQDQKSEVVKQKEEADRQRNEAHLQKELVEEKNREILDSIHYAKRLQEAILPPKRLVQKWLPGSFILYKPKDIVAGDFYWFDAVKTSAENDENTIYFAAADCTGHGVPGAMVSVVCSNALSKALLEERIYRPAGILDRTRELVIERFAKSEKEVKDGMDISLCALNREEKQLEWAGANNPLWIISKSEKIPFEKQGENAEPKTGELMANMEIEDLRLFEVKANKQPIGRHEAEESFTNYIFRLNKGDSLYIFSDGYADQFGGKKNKKFKTKNFKRLLLSVQNNDMQQQRNIIDQTFEDWKANLEQLDDVCVLGVKI